MQKLQCELCTSVSITKIDSTTFQCDYCRCKYTAQQMKEMLFGAVETTKGALELERQLKAAAQLAELGEHHSAQSKYAELRNEFPHDWRVWWESAYLELKDGRAALQFPPKSQIRVWYKHAKSLADEENKAMMRQKWDAVWREAVQLFEARAGEQLLSLPHSPRAEFLTDLHKLSEEFVAFSDIFKQGIANAQALHSADIGAFCNIDREYGLSVSFSKWSRISGKTLITAFVYGATIMVYYSDRVEQCGRGYGSGKLNITKIDSNVISDIHKHIKEDESTFIRKGQCPHCWAKLNWLKNKCASCGWQNK